MYHLIIYEQSTGDGAYIMKETEPRQDDWGSTEDFVYGIIVKILRSIEGQNPDLKEDAHWNFYRHRIRSSSEDSQKLIEEYYLELL